MTAEAQLAPPSEPVPAPGPPAAVPPRRSKWRWLGWSLLGATPVAIGALWVAVHSIPWMGPLVANTLRSVVGKENVTRLEEFVYSIEDRVNQTLKKDKRPRAYWKVPPALSATPALAIPAPSTSVSDAPPPKPPFTLASVGPVFTEAAAEGDGVWVPMTDPRRPGEAARMYKTLLHPDKSRSWAEVFVVAIDLGSVEVMPVMGYQEPRTEKKEAEGYVRKAKIPEENWNALLGAFNGGFMAEHGKYGVFFDGITFIEPREDSCTLVRYQDGSVDVAGWKSIAARRAEMLWFRQAPACMYESGVMHEGLARHQSRKWGATLDGNTVIRRSAVGISLDKQVFYVGISNHTNAKVMALGMHHAGAENVAQMDVNWSYPKFVTYEPDKTGRLVPIALAEGFEFDEHLFLRHRSMRDFFYLARKEEVKVPSVPPAPPVASAAGSAAPEASAAPPSSAPATGSSAPVGSAAPVSSANPDAP